MAPCLIAGPQDSLSHPAIVSQSTEYVTGVNVPIVGKSTLWLVGLALIRALQIGKTKWDALKLASLPHPWLRQKSERTSLPRRKGRDSCPAPLNHLKGRE